MAAAVAENLQLKAFILILFSSLASKGLQTPKVEKYLSYIKYVVFILRSLMLYAVKNKIDLYLTFVDISKAYDHATPKVF